MQLWRRHVDHLRKREASALEEEEERCPYEERNNVEKPAEELQNATQDDQQSSPERNDRIVTPPIAPRISTWIRIPPVRPVQR